MSTLELVRESIKNALRYATDALESLHSQDYDTAYDLLHKVVRELEDALNLLDKL